MTVQHRPGFARALRESHRILIGTWVKIPSLETVEILAIAGFDFVVIDMEHAPLDLQSAYAATVVAQGAGMHVLVRVPDRSGSHIQRMLDSGVDGILVPRVETPAAAATSDIRAKSPFEALDLGCAPLLFMRLIINESVNKTV